jgi:hypothetical protein
MAQFNRETLALIADLVEDTIDTVNPNPKVYMDVTGMPLVGGKRYTTLDENVIPVWSVSSDRPSINDIIYMVNLENRSYFAFTPREYKLQFKSEPVNPLA